MKLQFSDTLDHAARATDGPAQKAEPPRRPSFPRFTAASVSARGPSAGAPEEAATPRDHPVASPDTPRLLVLEDNTDSGELLKTLLDAQYDVTLFNKYDAALAALQHHRFDLLVLDINLGETRTGADLLRAARRLPSPVQTPAVACTAYATSDERGRSWYEDAGFDGYVRKPFEIDELFTVIERVLRRKRP